MKTSQKGSAVSLVLVLIAVLAVAGGVYYYFKHSANSNLKTYSDPTSPVSFSYPSTWEVNPAVQGTGDSVSHTFLLTKTAGNETLQLSFSVGPNGVGGACPDYNPAVSVVSSKTLFIYGKKMYLIYSGNKPKNTIEYAYVSGAADGACPNVAFVSLPDKNGLFSASLRGYSNDASTNLTSLKNVSNSDFGEAEQVLGSIAL